MYYKEERVEFLKRVVERKETDIMDHRVEIVALEEEIAKEKELNEENKKLRKTIENLEKKKGK